MENSKIKVAMVCNFSSDRIRKKLQLSSYRFINTFRKALGRSPYYYKDFAVWVEGIIYNCIDNARLDLFVISQHSGLVKKKEVFESDGIHYFFFRSQPCSFVKYINKKLFHQKLVKYRHNRNVVHGLISEINPDLVLLIGAENPHYSSTILGIKDKPIYVLCQSILTGSEFEGLFDKDSYGVRSCYEKRIMGSTDYVGVYCEKHRDLCRKMGYKGNIFRFQWPIIGKPVELLRCEKKYDFVNFANALSLEKGYHDCIHALAIVRKEYPAVRMALIEKSSTGKVKDELVSLINEYGLKDNIDFIPFFEKKEDLFVFIQTCRFAVLPCKADYISGTMLQSMIYGLPIVVYKTEGTPILNANKETVLIAEMCNIEDLAKKMTILMKNPEIANKLRENGFDYIKESSKGKEAYMSSLISNFCAILSHYYQGVPIPNEQLYLD